MFNLYTPLCLLVIHSQAFVLLAQILLLSVDWLPPIQAIVSVAMRAEASVS